MWCWVTAKSASETCGLKPLYPRPIGILGGTFDPIHHGHLRVALELLETLDLAEIRFVPCRIPAHRGTPQLSAEQRLTLVHLAMHGQPGFVADGRELQRAGPSFMVDTLASLREDFREQPLCLIIGSDAFRKLHTWHRWQELSQFAHIVVMRRPGALEPFTAVLEEFIAPRRIEDTSALHHQRAGTILFQSVTQLDISATQIRTLLARGHSPRFLLPEAVLAYIHVQALYRESPILASMTS